MISVVVPCCTRDQDQAIQLLNWIGELGMNQSQLFILCSKQCKVGALMTAGEKGFLKVTHIPDVYEMDSNWHEVGNHFKSAAGPNSLFTQAAWHFYFTTRTPWLFLEPDAIPCDSHWLRMIDDEYQVFGKPFLGYLVNRQTHPGDVGNHMSGVAVYPFDVPERANRAVSAGDTAFDIEGAEQILTQMAPSRTIFHRYRPPSFETQEDFDQRVPRGLAIYHSCKDGSIYPFLRKRLGMAQDLPAPQPVREVQLAEPLPSKQIVSGSIPVTHSPTVDIFIKTRPHDYPWLEWCLKSIDRNCTGFRKAILKAPDKECPRPDSGVKRDQPFILEVRAEKEPGYLWQQVCKLNADQHSDADFILFQDSDTIFTRPVTPSDFIKDGKPVWLYTPLDQARPDQHHWIGVMEKFLGKRPEHEWMRRHPFCVPRWAFEELRVFCKYRHGKTIEEYIMGEADPSNGLALRFSEWNCLGFFLWEYHRDKVHWVLDSEAEPACVYQGHTHSGEARKQEDLAKFREILDPATPSSGLVGLKEQGGVTPPVPTLTEASAIEFLASQVRDNPHKARIIRSLKTAWKGKGVRVEKKHWIHDENHVLAADQITRKGFLICVHSYPGANETFARHWPYFKRSGATRIAGIGTTDGKCTWPDGLDAVVDIGTNAYMKMKGKDDHLCRRLLDTVKWCLTQPEDRFMIVEYDTLILRKFPHFSGVHAHLTGGQVNGSKTKAFYHNPWAFDRGSGPALVEALQAVLPESAEYPNNSPDLFFGLAVERAQIKVKCCFKLFTRNSLDSNGDLELACEAAVAGVHVIHGVKRDFELESISHALNESQMALSHIS